MFMQEKRGMERYEKCMPEQVEKYQVQAKSRKATKPPLNRQARNQRLAKK